MELVSADEVADWLGLTSRRVQQMANEGVIPRAERGKYPLRSCVQAYCAFMRGQGGADPENGVQDLSSERAALAKAQRERTELMNRQLRGELIPARSAARVLQGLAGAMKARLLNLPDVVRQRHPDVSLLARAEMAALIEDALRQVATSGLPDEYREAVLGDGADPAAESEADLERVG